MTRRASKTKQAVHGPDLIFFLGSNAVLRLRCTANIAAPFRSSPRITRLPARPLPLPLCWAHLARTTHDHVRRLSPSSVQVCSSLACRLHAPWAWLAANGRPHARSLVVPLGLRACGGLSSSSICCATACARPSPLSARPLFAVAWNSF
jgi:hypothetical protein